MAVAYRVRTKGKNRSGHDRHKNYKAYTDRMTEKEFMKRNGDPQTYNFNRPYTWAEFKMYGADIQKYILEAWDKRYCICPEMLSIMFKRKTATIFNHIRPDHPKMVNKIYANQPTDDHWDDFHKLLGMSKNDGQNKEGVKVSAHHEPMDWEEFKKLPRQTIINFYSYVIDAYNASLKDIGRLFGVNYNKVYYHVNAFSELKEYANRYKNPNSAQREIFREECCGLTISVIAEAFCEEEFDDFVTMIDDDNVEDGPTTEPVITAEEKLIKTVGIIDTNEHNSVDLAINKEEDDTMGKNKNKNNNNVAPANTTTPTSEPTSNETVRGMKVTRKKRLPVHIDQTMEGVLSMEALEDVFGEAFGREVRLTVICESID